MIAVALSGGVDSMAAAILLHDRGERLMGISMRLQDDLPDQAHLKRAEELCRKLGIGYHLIDLSQAFDSIRGYFCESYRQFFDHAMPRFLQTAAQIRVGALVRPPELT